MLIKLIDLLTGGLIDWLIGWLIDWLIDWLISTTFLSEQDQNTRVFWCVFFHYYCAIYDVCKRFDTLWPEGCIHLFAHYTIVIIIMQTCLKVLSIYTMFVTYIPSSITIIFKLKTCFISHCLGLGREKIVCAIRFSMILWINHNRDKCCWPKKRQNGQGPTMIAHIVCKGLFDDILVMISIRSKKSYCCRSITGRQVCTFLFWMVHCGTWDRRIMVFVNLVYCN